MVWRKCALFLGIGWIFFVIPHACLMPSVLLLYLYNSLFYLYIYCRCSLHILIRHFFKSYMLEREVQRVYSAEVVLTLNRKDRQR